MYWIFAVIILLIMLLLSPTYIIFQINWNKKFKVNINFTLLFGLINRRIYNKNEVIEDNKDKNILVRIKKIKNIYIDNKKTIQYFLKKYEIVKLEWKTEYGFKDAAITGITNGLLWSIKNTVVGMLLNNTSAKDINISVIPDFKEKKFKMDFNCIIKIKTAYIIIGSLILITKKGGEIIARSSY